MSVTNITSIANLSDHPQRRPQIEKWLDDRNVMWVFEVHPLKDFDVEKSLRNQARLQALDKEKVEEYRIAMERGGFMDFPALVAYKSVRKLVAVDGNHRLNGSVQYGSGSWGVYVVDAPEEVIRVLTYQANIFNGLPTSHEERLVQAIHLIDMGMAAGEAAGFLGLSEGAVKAALSRTQADRRAAKLNIKGWTKLTAGARQRLGGVRTDEGMTAAAKLALSAALTVQEVNDLVTTLNKDTSAKGQVDLVDVAKARYKGRIQNTSVGLGKPRTFSAFNRFLGLIATIENFDIEEVAATSNLAGLGDGEFSDRCLQASERLMDICIAAERQAKEAEATRGDAT